VSGIVGVFSLDGRPVDDVLLARMSATLRHRGPDGEGRRVAGPAAFARQHLWVTGEEKGEAQPLVGRSGAMLVMDGRLDNRDELLSALRLPASTSDAACVLAAYETWGEGFAERLNGDFALAVFDPRQPRLLLVRDAIGIRPLYYHKSEHFFAFASEIKALLAHPQIPARPDDEGLADYMLPDSRPVDRQDITCFAGISAVVPAHLVVVTPERLMARRYWDFEIGRPLHLGSFEEYVEAFRERFDQAVARRIRSAYPVAVSVSGGLDSSSIFCQAEQQRRHAGATAPSLIGATFQGPEDGPADERGYLSAIERLYGVAIEQVPTDSLLSVAVGAEQQIWQVEAPILDSLWGVNRALHQLVHERGARVLITGHWGDQLLFSSGYLVDLARRFALRDIGRHLSEYQRWGAGETRVFRRQFVMDLVREHVPEILVPPLKWIRRRLMRAERPKPWFSAGFQRRTLRLASSRASLARGFHSVQAKALYLEARSKYHVHCMEWENKAAAMHGLEMALPYLDRDLVGFLIAIPGQVQNRGGVPRGLLREAMRGVLPEAIRARTSKGDFTDLVNTSVDRDLDHMASCLWPRSLAVELGYLQARAVADKIMRVDPHVPRTDALDSWEITDLFGLESWLRVFLSGARGAPS
jgi:asparagine synthase (glutamine-hydrolysing)